MVSNLSAPFLSQVPLFRERVDNAFPYIDILFGNRTEALAFAENREWMVRGFSLREFLSSVYVMMNMMYAHRMMMEIS